MGGPSGGASLRHTSHQKGLGEFAYGKSKQQKGGESGFLLSKAPGDSLTQKYKHVYKHPVVFINCGQTLLEN